MIYAKLINYELIIAPTRILHGGDYICNPPAEVLEAEGYLPVVYTDPPGEAPAGYGWSETWSEGDGNIVQGWVLVQIPISDDEALVRYANELTGAQDETLEEATETLIKKVMEE